MVTHCRRPPSSADMTRARDITGERFGALVAVHDTGRSDRKRRIWLFTCDCGQQQEAAIDRVTSPRDGWRACHQCRVRKCAVCSIPIPNPTGRCQKVCSPDCRAEQTRRINRGCADRRSADPSRRAAHLAKQRADRSDPIKGASYRASKAREHYRTATDPARREAKLAEDRSLRARIALRRLMAEAATITGDDHD